MPYDSEQERWHPLVDRAYPADLAHVNSGRDAAASVV